jgi:hypothetical protein
MEQYGIQYFDPVVDEWNEAARKRELHERATCDVCLYVFTPLLAGVYAVAEAVDDAHRRPDRTMLCVLPEDAGQRWTEDQYRSIMQVANLVGRTGAQVVTGGLPGVVQALRRRQVPPPVPAILRTVVKQAGQDRDKTKVCDHCGEPAETRLKFRGERWCLACLNPENGPRDAVAWAAENGRPLANKPQALE